MRIRRLPCPWLKPKPKQSLTRALVLSVIVAACGDDSPTVARKLDVSLAVSPDSTSAWAGDTVLFAVTLEGPDAGRLSLDSLRWSVSSDAVLALQGAGSGSLRIVAQREATSFVVARLGEISDSSVFVGMQEGAVLATFPFPVDLFSAPALDPNGSVYLLRNQGPSPGLVALTSSLTLRWEVPFGPLGATFLNPVVGPSGAVYFTQHAATRAYSSGGAFLWASRFAGEEDAAPALDGNENVYVHGFGADGIHRLARFSLSGDSTELDSGGLSSRVSPTVVADSVVVWVQGEELYSVARATARDGTLLWIDTLPDLVRYFAPSVGRDNRSVYLPAHHSVLTIDAFTGNRGPEWVIGSPEYPLAPIVDADGTVYVQTATRLIALNPDFSVRWQADSLGGGHGANGGGGPALAAGGVLYVNCGSDLCAVHTLDGSVRWRRSLPSSGVPGHVAIGPDSSIIFPMHVGGPSGSPSFLFKLRGRFPLADAPWSMDGGSPARTRRTAPTP